MTRGLKLKFKCQLNVFLVDGLVPAGVGKLLSIITVNCAQRPLKNPTPMCWYAVFKYLLFALRTQQHITFGKVLKVCVSVFERAFCTVNGYVHRSQQL